MINTFIYTEATKVVDQKLNCIQSIQDEFQPDAIFLLGTKYNQYKTESIFSALSNEGTFISQLFLLVLIPKPEKYSILEMHEMIERKASNILPTTCILLEASTFIHWCSIGHTFAVKVVSSSTPVYCSQQYSNSFQVPISPDTKANLLQRTYREGLEKSNEFFSGAELYLIRKQYQLSLFMLHQAAEQALSTLIKMGLGYYIPIHNVERLIRYASWTNHAVSCIFPLKSEEDKRVFKLFQRSYIDSRYNPEFTVKYCDLIVLRDKVSELMNQLKML